MRTLELIRALTDTEIKEVELLLSGGKREGLLRLFKELKKYTSRAEKPKHEELFAKVMKELYHKDKDYLLRNRMRQINEVLYEYLAIEAFKKAIHNDDTTFHFWLSKAYYDRKQRSLFEADIDSFIAQSKAEVVRSPTNLPDAGSNMFSLKTLWMINHDPRVPENATQQLAAMDEWMAELTRRTTYKVREMEARRAFIEMMLSHMKGQQPEASAAEMQALDLTTTGDWFARYLVLKKRVYQSQGADKIPLLKEMLQIGDVPEHRAILGLNDATTNLTNLATEMIVAGYYHEGNEALEQLMQLCKKNQEPIPVAALQNYVANQMNLGQYDKGLKVYDQYRREIESSRSAAATAIAACHLWLMLGQEDSAISHLPEQTALTAQHQIHYRYVYLISFVIRGAYELARTECGNLKRQIKRTESIDQELHLSIASLYDQYIKTQLLQKSEQAQKLKQLRLSLESRYSHWDKIAVRELPLRWLLVHLKIKSA